MLNILVLAGSFEDFLDTESIFGLPLGGVILIWICYKLSLEGGKGNDGRAVGDAIRVTLTIMFIVIIVAFAFIVFLAAAYVLFEQYNDLGTFGKASMWLLSGTSIVYVLMQIAKVSRSAEESQMPSETKANGERVLRPATVVRIESSCDDRSPLVAQQFLYRPIPRTYANLQINLRDEYQYASIEGFWVLRDDCTTGPYTTEDVKELLKKGQIENEDEISPAPMGPYLKVKDTEFKQ